MLLEHLLLGDRQLKPVNKVGEGIFVEDIVAVEGAVLPLEIETILASAESIEGSSVSMKATEAVVRVFKLFSRERADLLHQTHLNKLIEFVQLPNALLAEIYLKHGERVLKNAFSGRAGKSKASVWGKDFPFSFS